MRIIFWVRGAPGLRGLARIALMKSRWIVFIAIISLILIAAACGGGGNGSGGGGPVHMYVTNAGFGVDIGIQP